MTVINFAITLVMDKSESGTICLSEVEGWAASTWLAPLTTRMLELVLIFIFVFVLKLRIDLHAGSG
jgi:hypothetical protein